MIKSFIRNLIQVKALAFLITLYLVDRMSGFNIGELANSNDQCQKCNEENRELASLIDKKGTHNIRHSCVFIKEYLRCAEPLEDQCRQDLNFQGGLSLMRSFTKDHNCSSMNITWSEALRIMNKERQSGTHHVEPSEKKCRRKNFKPDYKICGLFGDPHLRTFSDKRHTCSVPGAWPLFANRYLTVQVTNIPLENSSRATATSKVVIEDTTLTQLISQQSTLPTLEPACIRPPQ